MILNKKELFLTRQSCLNNYDKPCFLAEKKPNLGIQLFHLNEVTSTFCVKVKSLAFIFWWSHFLQT